MTLLTVSLDRVAALRSANRSSEPDPAQAAVMAELAGADGITVRLRSDRMHIRERDLYLLREIVNGRFSVMIPPTDALIAMILEVKPKSVTLVADHPDSDAPIAGLDFSTAPVDFSQTVSRLEGSGVSAVFLVEPDPDSVKGAIKAGASGVMLDCTVFTKARSVSNAQEGLDQIDRAAQVAARSNISLAAHGSLDYRNVTSLAELGLFDEYVVGSAIASRAMLIGYIEAVRTFRNLIVRMPTPE